MFPLPSAAVIARAAPIMSVVTADAKDNNNPQRKSRITNPIPKKLSVDGAFPDV